MRLKRGGNVMEKKLKLIKRGSDYVLISDDSDVEIVIKDLKIDSKDIYDKLLKDTASSNESYKFVIEKELVEKEDKIIYSQLLTLFSKIEEALNKLITNPEDKVENQR